MKCIECIDHGSDHVLRQVAAQEQVRGEEFLKKNKSAEGVVARYSGLQYKVLVQGEGQYRPAANSSCECHYRGTLIDGTEFDSSYGGEPTTFKPGSLIKGWHEALELMVEGDKWTLFIPSHLAYGVRGLPPKIPGGAALVLEFELLKIHGDRRSLIDVSVTNIAGDLVFESRLPDDVSARDIKIMMASMNETHVSGSQPEGLHLVLQDRVLDDAERLADLQPPLNMNVFVKHEFNIRMTGYSGPNTPRFGCQTSGYYELKCSCGYSETFTESHGYVPELPERDVAQCPQCGAGPCEALTSRNYPGPTARRGFPWG
eukprot:gnl/TRDRNA2_/TRDRNA2_66606_c1_seq1.p1 gnl/TRDRNA2_/TRDRNA2_66606_c1~~gnl/TRDRNA2_/TRDRNA2_66606_c1_seq1.p1  ORF type:complete len:315 (+),score=33.48 gnl/TRDRNA2_/TRDRNA2_66606_c1_seq1:3-947(+)